MCRYVNSSAAKALFRAGRIEEAEAMAAKFTKHGEQLNGLTEMQCMWYEIECGHAYLRRREYGKVCAASSLHFHCSFLFCHWFCHWVHIMQHSLPGSQRTNAHEAA